MRNPLQHLLRGHLSALEGEDPQHSRGRVELLRESGQVQQARQSRQSEAAYLSPSPLDEHVELKHFGLRREVDHDFTRFESQFRGEVVFNHPFPRGVANGPVLDLASGEVSRGELERAFRETPMPQGRQPPSGNPFRDLSIVLVCAPTDFVQQLFVGRADQLFWIEKTRPDRLLDDALV